MRRRAVQLRDIVGNRVLPRALIFIIAASPLFAGPPLETDDPDTPGPGRWELNVASELEKRRDEWEFTPQLDLNYGVGDRVQIKLKPRGVILDEPDRSARGGLGKIQAGVKWRLFDESTNGVAASVYPQVDFNPPGHAEGRGLIDEGTDFRVPFQFSRTFERTRFFLEAGYVWREHFEGEWLYGIALEQPISGTLRLVGELRGGGAGGFDNHGLSFRAGGKWKLAEQVTLLMAAGHTIRDTDPGFLSYLGLQFTF